MTQTAIHYKGKDSLERKILLRFLHSTFAIVILYGIHDFFTHDDKVLMTSCIVLTIFGICYLLNLYSRFQKLSRRITVAIFMLSTISGFFFQGGIMGVNTLDVCAIIVVITIVFSGNEKRIFLFLCIVQILTLASIQVFHSEWIIDHHGNDPLIIRVCENFARYGNILYICYLYKTEFERERKQVFETSERLEEMNTEASIQNELIVSSNNKLEKMMAELEKERNNVEVAKVKLETQNEYITAFNNQLKLMVVELKKERAHVIEINEKLEEANTEISAQSEMITMHNKQLEVMVNERTNDLQQLNKKLVEYAFSNSHKIRGPLARVMGLVNLIKLDHQNDNSKIVTEKDYIDKLYFSSLEMDEVIKNSTKLLNEDTKDWVNTQKEELLEALDAIRLQQAEIERIKRKDKQEIDRLMIKLKATEEELEKFKKQ